MDVDEKRTERLSPADSSRPSTSEVARNKGETSIFTEMPTFLVAMLK